MWRWTVWKINGYFKWECLGLRRLDSSIARPDMKKLQSKYVRDWRFRGGCWVRRSRLVAKEFRFLEPELQNIYASASMAVLQRVFAGLCVSGENLVLYSVDVSDAHLMVPQEKPLICQGGEVFPRFCTAGLSSLLLCQSASKVKKKTFSRAREIKRRGAPKPLRNMTFIKGFKNPTSMADRVRVKSTNSLVELMLSWCQKLWRVLVDRKPHLTALFWAYPGLSTMVA